MSAGASLQAEGNLLKTFHDTALINTKRLTVINTTFDGTDNSDAFGHCTVSSIGLPWTIWKPPRSQSDFT